jgi:Flp pilus assembly protein TadG
MSNGPRRLRDWRNASATRVEVSPDQSESGAALVEFTIIMPLFFLVFFGIIEWGLIFFFQNTMQSAAEVAARVVAVNGYTTSAQAKPFVCPWLMNNSFGGSLTFAVQTTDLSSTGTCAVQAQITTSATGVSIINFLNMIGGNLKTTASMPKEPVINCTQSSNVITFNCP